MSHIPHALGVNLKNRAKRLLRRFGFDVVRTRDVRGGVDEFIPHEPTLEAARKAGMSVGDYIDHVMSGTPGATEASIDAMRTHGVFATGPTTVLEIGPGSGRYLDRTLRECEPDHYEIYETAQSWADYLVREYGVVAQPTAGCNLGSTADSSIDLVHAHKVFNTVTFLCTSRYLPEMARVTRPGGWVVLDAMTEACLDIATVDTWARFGGEGHDSYPSPLPRQVCQDVLAAHDCHLEASEIVPMGVGVTELLIFRKTA